MASQETSGKWAFINGISELEGIEIINSNDFLMSLMEELQDQVDERDEEKLNRVIQSLEAEINCSTMDYQDACMEPDHQPIYDKEKIQSSGLGQMDDRDCSVSFDDLDLNGWIGDIEAVPSCSPSHDINLDIYRFGEETSSVIGFGGVSGTDYNGIALDDNSFWQEYDSVMYD